MVYPHSYRTKNSETITTSSAYGDYYAQIKNTKIRIQPKLLPLLQWIDTFRPRQIRRLKEMVEIPSVSGSVQFRDELNRMKKLVEFWFGKLGMKHECFNISRHVTEGKTYNPAPVILGQLGHDKEKYTVCIYGHFDVADPTCQEGWTGDPFTFRRENKCFYGAGIGTSKAPLSMWFHAIQAFRETKTELPVNLRFIIEAMNEQHSEGLEPLLRTHAIGLLKGIDFIVVTDSNWLGKNLPCLTYGAVGYFHFWLTSEKVPGSNSEPKDDLESITGSMVGERGHINIENHDSCVAQITPDEELVTELIREFDVREIQSVLPAYKKNWDKVKLFMNFWRMPGLQINDIQECTCDKKTKGPLKMKQSYMYKAVPNQIPERLAAKVDKFITNLVAERKITNKIENRLVYAVRPWVEDYQSAHYEAAKRATIQVYKEVPSLIRDDREYPVLLILKRVFDKSILMLPLFNSEVNFRLPNEHVTERSYFEGTKLVAAYLLQISYIQPLNSNANR